MTKTLVKPNLQLISFHLCRKFDIVDNSHTQKNGFKCICAKLKDLNDVLISNIGNDVQKESI